MIAYVPILGGYVLGTIGALALPFLTADRFAAPIHAEQIRPGLLCEITEWGAAFDGGYTVHLYRFWPIAPILRRQVASVSVTETGENGVTNTICKDIATQKSL